MIKRKRCKICKRGYGYYGDLGCVHVWADRPWEEIEKEVLEEYEWEPKVTQEDIYKTERELRGWNDED
jgi:hypothetical protein